MDMERFERALRSLTMSSSRRQTLGGLVGALLVSVLGGRPLVVTAKGKKGGGKGGGKSKGCGKGKKKCGNKCIAKSRCCTFKDCDRCKIQSCVDGQCRCPDGWVDHFGVCGVPPNCKSVGLICTSHEQCCSRLCTLSDGVQMRCAPGHESCVVPFDCVSGDCRGYMCSDFYRSTYFGAGC